MTYFMTNKFFSKVLLKTLSVSILGLMLFGSCVPLKKITYLQNKSETDTIDVFKLERTEYKIQVNDILNIRIKSLDPKNAAIFSTETQTGQNAGFGEIMFYVNGYTVDSLGQIEMPLLGKIDVVGLTALEAREAVQTEISKFLNNSTVSLQLSGIRFSVVGEVGAPGRMVAFQNQLTIFEALAIAGDITQVGDRRMVQVLRQTPDGMIIAEIDLTSKNAISSPYFFIMPNDIINVKPYKQKTFGTGVTGQQTFQTFVQTISAFSSILLIINLLK